MKTQAITSRRTFVATSVSGILATAVIKAPSKAAQFELKCGQSLPLDHPIGIRSAQMWKTVERESGGRLSVQFFPNGMLGGDDAMFSQLRVGALAFMLLNPGNLASVVPIANISLLGFAYRDATEAVRVADGPVGGYVREASAAKGIYVFPKIFDTTMNQIATSLHPIRTPEDLRGFRARVLLSRISVDLFKQLGASPVGMNFAETYTALQTKVVDGTSTPLVTIEAAKFYEVTKYISLTNHAWGGGNWLVANADTWKSLPPDLQAIVERNSIRFAQLERRDTTVMGGSLLDKLARQGITFNNVDQTPFRARLSPYYDAWSKEFGSTAWGMLEGTLGHKLA